MTVEPCSFWQIGLRAIAAVALSLLGTSLRAQSRTDVIVGSAHDVRGSGIPFVMVVVTVRPSGGLVQGQGDSIGRFRLLVANGTGDYSVLIAARGFRQFRTDLHRSSESRDTVLAVTATLVVDSSQMRPQMLAPTTTRATRAKPVRGNETPARTGADDRSVDVVAGALDPSASGDVQAMLATMPGVLTTPNGPSVLGLGAEQNRVTLDGMTFDGATIPRDAQVSTRVTTSAFDPMSGGFGAALISIEMSSGSLFASHSGHLTLNSPKLEFNDAVSTAAGQRISNLLGSIGGSGALTRDDKYFYSYGLQTAIRHVASPSLSDAGTDVLAHLRVAPDSVAQLLTALANAKVAVNNGRAIDGLLASTVSAIARIDHSPFDWTTFKNTNTTEALTAYLSASQASGIALDPTSTEGRAGNTRSAMGQLQGYLSTYVGEQLLIDARSALAVSTTASAPFLRLPGADVLVNSQLPNGEQAFQSLQFGGNSQLDRVTTRWRWETQTTGQWLTGLTQAHRLKAAGNLRFDSYSTHSGPDLGNYQFASIQGVAQNDPVAFTRTVGVSDSRASSWSGFGALADYWSPSPNLSFVYGGRVEAVEYFGVGRREPGIDETFQVRSGRLPRLLEFSPRFGLTWTLNPRIPPTPSALLGTFHDRSRSYFTAGIGDFRSSVGPDAFIGTLATARHQAESRIFCAASTVPAPNWPIFVEYTDSIPNSCASTAAGDDMVQAATRTIVDPNFKLPHSWRGSVGFATSIGRIDLNVLGQYSLNLNQRGTVDLNFANAPVFSTLGEHRPVFVSPDAIIPTTGVVAPAATRLHANVGEVVAVVSDLKSTSRQLLVAAQPQLGSRVRLNLSYTLSQVESQARGFDGSTASDLTSVEWGRGAFDIRHQLRAQFGFTRSGITVGGFASLLSGAPFTPLIGSDVNGDGRVNDRAFVFAPGTTSDSSVEKSIESLLRSSHAARQCLRPQLGRMAARNSCSGPWTSQMNAQIAVEGRRLHLSRITRIAIALANPLGGLDELLHGARIRGWGTAPLPDPVLFYATGFDPNTRSFRYNVNPNFASTDPAHTTARAPFRLTIDVGFSVGASVGEQQVERYLYPGRSLPGPKLTVAQLRARYQRDIPNPFVLTMLRAEPLSLSLEQMDSLRQADRSYRLRLEPILTELAEFLSLLPEKFDAKAAYDHQEQSLDDAWEITRVAVQSSLSRLLSPRQIRLLPVDVAAIYNATTLRGYRVITFGPR